MNAAIEIWYRYRIVIIIAIFFLILNLITLIFLYRKICQKGYKPPNPFYGSFEYSKFFSYIKKNVKEKNKFPINLLIILHNISAFIYFLILFYFIIK